MFQNKLTYNKKLNDASEVKQLSKGSSSLRKSGTGDELKGEGLQQHQRNSAQPDGEKQDDGKQHLYNNNK